MDLHLLGRFVGAALEQAASTIFFFFLFIASIYTYNSKFKIQALQMFKKL
jgi:hypothetical protein